MHFLIATSPQGHKLVDFGDEVMRLKTSMNAYMETHIGHQPAIFNEKMVRDAFLCDEYGIPVADDGFLIRLDDL